MQCFWLENGFIIFWDIMLNLMRLIPADVFDMLYGRYLVCRLVIMGHTN